MSVVPKNQVEDTLRKLIPLNTLPPDAMERLLPDIRFEKAGSGDYLFHKGDLEEQNVYLLTGRVSLMNDRSEIDVVVGGSNLAKFPIAHRLPRECSAIAKSRCELVRIDSSLLVPLLREAEQSRPEPAQPVAGDGDDWMGQLLGSRVFQHLPPSNIQAVMRRMEAIEVEAGQEITRQGETGDNFYLINQGRCRVSRTNDDGRNQFLAELGPGDCFGEEALLSNRPRGCTVTVVENGVLLQLPGEDFSNYVKRSLFRTVDFSQARSMVESGAVWLDVRQYSEYCTGHISGSVNIPLDQLRRELAGLEQDLCHVVCCQDEQTSTAAAFLLIEAGIDTVVLKGGVAELGSDLLAPEEEPAEESDASIAEYGVEELRQALEQARGERDDAKEQLDAALARTVVLEQQLRDQDTAPVGAGSSEVAALRAELATLSAALDGSYEDYEKMLERAERAEEECSRLKAAV